jgi:hypothetical protein
LLCALLLLLGAGPLLGSQPLYNFPMDSNPGWTTEGGWAFGTPTGAGGACANPDPTSGHTGSNVYGYNLSGDYGNLLSPEYLTTGAMDCSSSTATTLVFWRWLGVDSQNWSDYAAVQVSNDGTNWTTIWENPVSTGTCDYYWQFCVYDISAIADGQPTVYIRWQMGPTEASWNLCGWNVDDVQIWSGSPPPVPASHPVYTWTLDANPGWTMEGAWQFGQPTGVGGDPTSGHTGTNVYGYNLSGYYTNSMPAYSLTTTAINCSSVTGATLVFWRWLGVESSYYDHAVVLVSNDGANWTTLWQNSTTTLVDSYWQLCVYDISAIADGQSTVYIRWVMGPTDSSVTYGGWNIDDIQIWNGPPVSILAWTAYADMDEEYVNTLQALTDKLGSSYLVQQFPTNGQGGSGDATLLAKQLEGKQVFLAIEQENATPTQATTAGTEFASTLQSFVGNGGTLAACGDGWLTWSGQFLTATGLMTATTITSYPSGTLYVVEDWHPLVQGVGATMAAQDGTTSYTVGSETLSVVQDGSGDTTLAVRDYGAGAVVLLGSDFYSYDSDGAQLLANAVLYPRYARRILLYDDGFMHVGAEALRRLGHPFTQTGPADFDQALTTRQWDLVVLDNPNYWPIAYGNYGYYDSLLDYLGVWGKSAANSWRLGYNPELATGYCVSPATTLSALTPVYQWYSDPFFTTPNSVPDLYTWDDWMGYGIDGFELTTVYVADAYAGYTASEQADKAAVVAGKCNGTVMNGFLWDERGQDADGDGVQDVTELVMNEIVNLSNSGPYVDMSFTPSATITGTSVNFVAHAGASAAFWNPDWYFGDGAYSTGLTTVSHAYDNPGFYSPSFLVYDGYQHLRTRVAPRQLVVGFPDAPPGYWACNYIVACYEGGIVQGYWDGYHPVETVTRAQMAVYVARGLAGGDANVPPGPGVATFPDVPTNYWAFKYVEYCYAQGIVTGYWDGYHPEETVTRAQMAVYSARAIVDPSERPDLPSYTPPGTATFPDVPTGYWAYKYVEYCYAQQIVTGYWDGYHPEELVNRGQMAVYMQRAFHLWIPYT